MTNRSALFIDRDGVVNKPVIKNGLFCSPNNINELELFTGADKAVEIAHKLGLLAIIFTNQPEVARGTLLTENLRAMHSHILQELRVDDIFVCPHDDKDGCLCRKPKPGMLYEAASKWNIDLKKSYVIGDTWRDALAGEQAGCKILLVKSRPENTSSYSNEKQFHYDYCVDNLLSAVEIISSLIGRKSA